MPGVALHLLDVETRVEAAPGGGRDDAPDLGIAAHGAECVGEVVPALHGQCVDGRTVDGDDGNACGGAGLEVETPMSGSAIFPPSIC